MFSELRTTPPAAGSAAAPAPDAEAPRAFDLDAALSTVEGDTELLCELIAIFREDYPAQLDELSTAVEAQDSQAVQRIAHSLKGAVGNFAAEQARQSAFTLETMGRNAALESAPQALAALREHMQHLDRAFTAFLEKSA